MFVSLILHRFNCLEVLLNLVRINSVIFAVYARKREIFLKFVHVLIPETTQLKKKLTRLFLSFKTHAIRKFSVNPAFLAASADPSLLKAVEVNFKFKTFSSGIRAFKSSVAIPQQR
jgi:hypothetical protein